VAGVGGTDDNVLLFTPPLCFTQSNVRQVILALTDILPHVDMKDFKETNGNQASPRKKCKVSAIKNTIKKS